jgi:imidazolonepropionase-like amidohydrolase
MSSSPNHLEDWEFVPRNIDIHSRKTLKKRGLKHGLYDDPSKDEEDILGVFASLLIPGQDDPQKDQAILLDRISGKIVFVGDRSSIPSKYRHVKLREVPVVMPGMWECHSHFMGASPNRPIDSENLGMTNPTEAGARSVRALKETLYAGFTSCVDLGGYACELQKAIDEGLILGPTLYGAGAAISMTAGHGEVFE